MNNDLLLRKWRNHQPTHIQANEIKYEVIRARYGSSLAVASYASPEVEKARGFLDNGDVIMARMSISNLEEHLEQWIEWDQKIVETNGSCLR